MAPSRTPKKVACAGACALSHAEVAIEPEIPKATLKADRRGYDSHLFLLVACKRNNHRWQAFSLGGLIVLALGAVKA